MSFYGRRYPLFAIGLLIACTVASVCNAETPKLSALHFATSSDSDEKTADTSAIRILGLALGFRAEAGLSIGKYDDLSKVRSVQDERLLLELSPAIRISGAACGYLGPFGLWVMGEHLWRRDSDLNDGDTVITNDAAMRVFQVLFSARLDPLKRRLIIEPMFGYGLIADRLKLSYDKTRIHDEKLDSEGAVYGGDVSLRPIRGVGFTARLFYFDAPVFARRWELMAEWTTDQLIAAVYDPAALDIPLLYVMVGISGTDRGDGREQRMFSVRGGLLIRFLK